MKVLYMHIPKTGGTSFKHAFDSFEEVITENSSIIKRSPIFHQENLKVLNFKISNCSRFKKILNDKWDHIWKVALVRNPWDRYVSNWKWLTRKEKLYPTKGWSARGWKGEDGQISFENFVKQMSQCYIELNKLHGYQHDKWHIRNQIEHLVDERGKIMVDYVARFENIEQEFSFVCEKAGISTSLPYLNHTGHYSGEEKTHQPTKIHYSKYYTPELIEIVRERCSADIETFDYEYEEKNE